MKGNAYMAISEIVITEDMKEYRNIAARYHNFSDNFNAKIMRISKLRFSSGGAAVSRRFSPKRVGRNLAMAIIVAVLSLQGMISMLADAPKESTLEYGLKTRPVANGMLEVNFLDDQTVGELNLPAGELTLPAVVDYHSPTYFPEGYYVTDDVKEHDSRILILENDEGDLIVFDQENLWGTININRENAYVRKVEINGHEGVASTRYENGETAMVWSDGNYRYIVTCTSDKVDVLKFANSVQSD